MNPTSAVGFQILPATETVNLPSRLTYRATQFWHALLGPKAGVGTESIRAHLSPTQLVLFRRLQPSEQVHAFRVLELLKAAGQTDPDLLTAALLHDIGKIFSPLSACDRVTIVIGQRFFRGAAKRWGQGPPRGLRRPFVVAERHPEWGADLARQAGASPRTVDLIRRHQEPLAGPPRSHADRLLAALREADGSN